MSNEKYPVFDDKHPHIPEEDLAKEAIKFDIYIQTKETITRYGLELAEDKIKDIYKFAPVIKEKMLRTLYSIWGRDVR